MDPSNVKFISPEQQSAGLRAPPDAEVEGACAPKKKRGGRKGKGKGRGKGRGKGKCHGGRKVLKKAKKGKTKAPAASAHPEAEDDGMDGDELMEPDDNEPGHDNDTEYYDPDARASSDHPAGAKRSAMKKDKSKPRAKAGAKASAKAKEAKCKAKAKAKARAATKGKEEKATAKAKAKAKAKGAAKEHKEDADKDHEVPKPKQAKLTTEQKQVKSRKSVAYHHARKAALEEGKTEEEAKLIAQAVFPMQLANFWGTVL